MPSTLTVILNANQAKKFALLLRSPDAPKATILREARNKFRITALSQVFLQGGASLEENESIQSGTTTVWIGKGEPYSGSPLTSQHSNHAEVRILAEASFINDKAVKQLEQVAELPGVRLAVGMPDLHPGPRFPIGCAIAADGVYPALVDSDIGCGIALYHLAVPSRSHRNPSKLASLLVNLDQPWSGSVVDWLANYGIHRTSPFDRDSLGSVGAGNHFAEICTVERLVDLEAAERLGVRDDALFLLVHTGSRGLGASIFASMTTTESNLYIPPDSPLLADYLVEHDYAVRWAIANRDLVAHRIQQCLRSSVVTDGMEAHTPKPHELGKIIDVTHNSVTLHSLTLGQEFKDVWIHRKGAAPADMGVIPCPGSRGDFSWLLEPIGDGQLNAHSLAHGAGRRHARGPMRETKLPKTGLRTTSLGSEVICTDTNLLLEERPEAYKSVERVVSDLELHAVCRGIVVFRPLVTYKTRECKEVSSR